MHPGKVGYTDDGMVFVGYSESMAYLKPGDAIRLADDLALGNTSDREWAQELRKAAKFAQDVLDKLDSPLWYPGKVE
jgi:hypothetical protein